MGGGYIQIFIIHNIYIYIIFFLDALHAFHVSHTLVHNFFMQKILSLSLTNTHTSTHTNTHTHTRPFPPPPPHAYASSLSCARFRTHTHTHTHTWAAYLSYFLIFFLKFLSSAKKNETRFSECCDMLQFIAILLPFIQCRDKLQLTCFSRSSTELKQVIQHFVVRQQARTKREGKKEKKKEKHQDF